MYPATIALPNELREAYLSLLLHLPYEVEQLAVLRFRACYKVCCTSQQMVTILCSTHELIQLFAAVSTTDYDRCSPRLAYGVKELLY